MNQDKTFLGTEPIGKLLRQAGHAHGGRPRW